ncbi:sulfatase-like hydrolase/transferase, partial [candidate division KSB1 bacterium]|nr:sulfatase-like hydrolase/transferase [candidate division KSB1 bacterium]
NLRSEIRRPNFIKAFPEYLREAGYYCTNNSKTDYNFNPDGIWDENSNQAHWRNRPAEKPFFSVFNLGITHEGSTNSRDEKPFEKLSERHDPALAKLPPYFSDTPEMRRIWARCYDQVTLMDQQAGEILQQLEADGLREDTIIFFFSDHGFGLPRYKRWAYRTGLQVPLLISVPLKFQHLVKNQHGKETENMVSFVDFAPTVLSLAGIQIPSRMEGFAFLGNEVAPPREIVFGARSRADDVYDVSRTIIDKKFVYIRNFMPHLPYIQRAIITDDSKTSYKEIRRAHLVGELPPAGEAMWHSKPVEELYNLEKDPNELNNLAQSVEYQPILVQYREQLRAWILQTRDTEFLHEAEMMIRSKNSTPFEMARNSEKYNLPAILAAAETVGNPSIQLEDLVKLLEDSDSGVRFWAIMALQARNSSTKSVIEALVNVLDDLSPCVQIAAAETLCHFNQDEKALPVLVRNLNSDLHPTVVLQAARSVQCIGFKAKPILSEIKSVLKKYSGTVWGRYKDWLYSMFIGMALDRTLINCGEKVEIKSN